MVAGTEDLHQLVRRHERGNGQHATAERLAEHHAVGPHVLVFASQEFAGSAHAGLDLVDEQQHAMLAADARALGEITLRRHDDPALQSQPRWHA